MFLTALSFVGAILGFVFLVLSIASGLYYVSELVEEHSEPTKRFLKKVIYTIIGLFVLLYLFDSFPLKLSLFSIFSYYVYLQNLNKFPYVQLTSPVFLASCILVVANHFLWFNHFHHPVIPPLEVRLRHDYVPPHIPSFVEVCLFFGICVWFVPFALFVSLSAHDNLLPLHDTMAPSPSSKKKNNGLAKVVVAKVRDYVYSAARTVGWELDKEHGRII